MWQGPPKIKGHQGSGVGSGPFGNGAPMQLQQQQQRKAWAQTGGQMRGPNQDTSCLAMKFLAGIDRGDGQEPFDKHLSSPS